MKLPEAEEKEAWFAEVMRVTFGEWLALADERLEPETRCFVMPGNDDPGGRGPGDRGGGPRSSRAMTASCSSRATP